MKRLSNTVYRTVLYFGSSFYKRDEEGENELERIHIHLEKYTRHKLTTNELKDMKKRFLEQAVIIADSFNCGSYYFNMQVNTILQEWQVVKYDNMDCEGFRFAIYTGEYDKKWRLIKKCYRNGRRFTYKHKNRHTIITLDIDKDVNSNRVKDVVRYIRSKRWQCKYRVSASGNNIHMKILKKGATTWNRYIMLRQLMFDDPDRIALDIVRHNEGLSTGVLWDKKGSKKAGGWKKCREIQV